jgi:hypothetical protein
MTKQLFLIDYEGSQWCGGQSHCVVWAEDEDDAREVAEAHMDETMRELFSDEYADLIEEESEGAEEEQSFSVNSVEAFGPEHEHWKWFQDSSQGEFYPIVGEE